MPRLTSYYVNPVALCVTAGLGIAMIFLSRGQWPICITGIFMTALLAWTFNFRRMQAISEVPVSSIASAAQGYVELLGNSVSLLPLNSPIRKIPSVWYRYWVYARTEGGVWNLRDYRCGYHKFGLQDASGYCEVDPEGAEIIASERHVFEQNGHRYIEDVLRAGQKVYVLGELDARSNIHLPSQIKADVGEMLTEWKGNFVKYLSRFDLDRDGRIDLHEWELARQAAHAEVMARHDAIGKQVHVISQPSGDRRFLIAGISPQALRDNYRFWVRLHLLLMLAAVVGFALAVLP